MSFSRESESSVGGKSLEKSVPVQIEPMDGNHIRVSYLKNEPYLAWGVVKINDLYFCFAASYSRVGRKRLSPDEPPWFTYAPVPIHRYVSPIPDDKGLSEEEKEEILRALGKKVKEKKSFPSAMQEYDKEYDAFLEQYRNDLTIRQQYGTFVKEALSQKTKLNV